MFCGNITKKDGRVGLGSAAAAEFHDMDWLQVHLRADEEVQIKSLTNDQTTLVVAGPKARDVLSAVSRLDWSKEAFPWRIVGDGRGRCCRYGHVG